MTSLNENKREYLRTYLGITDKDVGTQRLEALYWQDVSGVTDKSFIETKRLGLIALGYSGGLQNMENDWLFDLQPGASIPANIPQENNNRLNAEYASGP